MTKFISSFSTHQLLPPWQSKNQRMWAFVIHADRERIQAHLDRNFNSPGPDYAPYRYHALPDPCFGVLMVVEHPDFSSVPWVSDNGNWHPHHDEVDDDSDAVDRLSHIEVYWTFPALRYRVDADNLLSDPALVWIQPFAFDNNEYVVFSAREIWGTEMEIADVRIVNDSSTCNFRVDVAIEGLVTFSSFSKSHRIGCLRIGLTDGALPLQRQGVDENLKGFLVLLKDLVGRSRRPDGVLQGIEVNTLKQFRDVFDMDVAAYRAIVASRTVLTDVEDLALFEGANAVVDFFCSDSIKETLVRLFGERMTNAPSRLEPLPGSPCAGDPEVDWTMPLFPLDVAAVVACTADAHFSVTRVLHTYGEHF